MRACPAAARDAVSVLRTPHTQCAPAARLLSAFAARHTLPRPCALPHRQFASRPRLRAGNFRPLTQPAAATSP